MLWRSICGDIVDIRRHYEDIERLVVQRGSGKASSSRRRLCILSSTVRIESIFSSTKRSDRSDLQSLAHQDDTIDVARLSVVVMKILLTAVLTVLCSRPQDLAGRVWLLHSPNRKQYFALRLHGQQVVFLFSVLHSRCPCRYLNIDIFCLRQTD
jgi:hypothetical protein